MRTHPDIGLVIADLLQLARFLAVYQLRIVEKKDLFSTLGGE